MPREYPAKILLYGEHTVLRSGRGLAVPYPGLSLRWSRSTPDEQLLRFCDYLKIAIPEDVLETGLLEDHLLADCDSPEISQPATALAAAVPSVPPSGAASLPTKARP